MSKMLCANSRKLLIPFLLGVVLCASRLLRAQSSGPNIDECSSEAVDSYNNVEETVCLYGDASGVTASAEVDSSDYSGLIAGVDADETLYNGSVLLYDSGDIQSSGSAVASYGFSPVIGTVYTLNSLFGECIDDTYSWNYSTCYWNGDSSGPSVQAEVTPGVSLTTSAPSLPTGDIVTFTASVTGGLTGTITFYDGATAIGTGTISGSDATYVTSSLANGYHSITAYWPGNSTYGPITSPLVAQTVFQPGPMQIPTNGLIATVAGNGIEYSSGDDGYAMSAELSQPTAAVVDSAGNLYIADSNLRIRKVNASTGIITTVAGNGSAGYSGDGGTATDAELNGVYGIALDGSGNIYIADSGNQRIRKVTASTGVITTVAGNGVGGFSGDGGLATNAELLYPQAVAVDSVGNIYIADANNERIRKVSFSTGVITTVAGNGTRGFSGDGSAATAAEINIGYASGGGLAVDSAGNIYIADFGNYRVRKVTASTGIISTIAGNGTWGFSGDGGPATSAEISHPAGLAFDLAGNLYIADFGNDRIRRVTDGGTITTVVGNGRYGYSGDGGPAISAELWVAADVVVDSNGNLYIADQANNRIRAVGGTNSLPAPTGLSATNGIGQISLAWTAVSGATSYNVYVGTVSGGEGSAPVATGVSAAAYTATGLTSGIAYYFEVTAVNSSGMSGLSNEAEGTPTSSTPASITVATSGSPSFYGNPVTFTATVPIGDTNTVTFYSGGSSIGTATPSSGTALFTTSSLAQGTDVITASIAAGGNYTAATSSAINQIVNQPTPAINGISPTSGPVGTPVTISGTGFEPSQGQGTVRFNSTVANVSGWDNTSIETVVPTGATTGNIEVVVGGVSSNGVPFTVEATSPTVASLSPSSGYVGLAVHISGSGFGAAQGQGYVTFNGSRAGVLSWSDSSITAVIPSSPTTGPVVVTIDSGQSSNNNVILTINNSSCSF